MTVFRMLLPLLVAVVPAAPALAEVDSFMEALRVIEDQDGRETFEEARSARPGEVIEYRLTYKNSESTPVSQLKAKGPVPAGTRYVADSARSDVRARLRFSHDGGVTWQAAPLKRKAADGKGEEVVPPEHYSHVQWTAGQPLEKGKPQTYSYRVQVAEPEKPGTP